MGIKGIDHWVIVAGIYSARWTSTRGSASRIAWEKRPGRPDDGDDPDQRRPEDHRARPRTRRRAPATRGGGSYPRGAGFCLSYGGGLGKIFSSWLKLQRGGGGYPLVSRMRARGFTPRILPDPDDNLVEFTVNDR